MGEGQQLGTFCRHAGLLACWQLDLSMYPTIYQAILNLKVSMARGMSYLPLTGTLSEEPASLAPPKSKEHSQSTLVTQPL